MRGSVPAAQAMSETHSWLDLYERRHGSLAWPWLYWLAVPMTVAGLVGLLWNLPVPVEFVEISPFLNWGSAFLMAAAVYYFVISLPLAIGMLPFVLALAFLEILLTRHASAPLAVSGGLLGVGAACLWFARRQERSLGSLVHDLQTIMLAPPWLLSLVYRRFGIPY